MLHRRDTVRTALDDDVFASSDLTRALPKYRMPAEEQDPRHVLQLVRDELMLDGNSRQNLATFCQTWAEPEVRAIMASTLDKNMVDKDEYPQTAELEARCVHILADLWNAPDAANTIGTSTTGSSEAAMLGGMAMLRRWRQRRKAAGLPTDRPNLVTGPVQICWHKFVRYWDVEIREIPMEGDRLIMTAEEALARVDENTIGVVPTLGVTFTGQYEPVEAVSNALDDLQARTGLDVPIHVDGASGGFLAPFVRSRAAVGLPASAGQVDQRLRPQVRSGSARRRLDHLARRGRPARGAGLQRQLPRRQHADLGAELLPSRRPGDRAVLQLPAAGPTGLPPDPRGRATATRSTWPTRSPSSARSRSSTTATATASPPCAGS